MRHRLRGAMIGTGYSAGLQLRAWSQIPTAEIVAIAGETTEAAHERARAFGIPAAYGDYQTMLADQSLDFVDIATPPATHEELVTAVAGHRHHILCQKPASGDLASVRRMIEACNEAGVIFGINENCRFQPWFRAIRQRIDAGVLGEPISAGFTTRARLSLPTPRFVNQPYFVTMPRLIVSELGVHFLDTARYLFGPAKSIYAATRRVSPHLQGEDVAVMLITHAHASVIVDLSWAGHPTWAWESIGWADVRVDGTAGSLHLRTDGVMRIVDDAGENIELFEGDPIGDGYRAAQAHFADCLLDGQEPETSGTDQYHTMELVLGAYESASSGEVYHVGRDTSRLL